MNFSKEVLLKSITFKTSRSGGKGGQNVNKVSSKVELNLDIRNSELFSANEKETIISRLTNRISAEGVLQIITEEDRSQLRNKERSIEKLIELLQKALHVPKSRRATKPKKGAIEKRLQLKQANARKKINRRNGGWE